jgi:hypothetical protein
MGLPDVLKLLSNEDQALSIQYLMPRLSSS